MDKDIITFIKITAITILIVAVIIYFIVRTRSKRYIVFVDRAGIRTKAGQSYSWENLKKVHYINKRIIGGGLAEKNYRVVFHFATGKAEIDIHSNIYHYLLDIAKSAKVPSTSVVTKGLFKPEE